MRSEVNILFPNCIYNVVLKYATGKDITDDKKRHQGISFKQNLCAERTPLVVKYKFILLTSTLIRGVCSTIYNAQRSVEYA